MNMRSVLLAAAALPLLSAAAPDPLEPKTDAASALVSPLRGVTVVSGDMAATRRFYADAMAMTEARPGVFVRTGIADAAKVTVVAAPKNAPLRRPGWEAQSPGGLALGMPLSGQAAREAVVTAAGFKSAVGVTTMTLPRGDGTTYSVGEIHYQAPDGVLVLGIDRADMRPVGPIDAATKIGGPAYSSAVVEDADKAGAVLRDVLGLELRREFTYTSAGPSGGLGLPDGTRVRFQQWFAPGSRTGYVILLDLLNAGAPAVRTANARGIAAWSFEAKSLGVVAARAKAAGLSDRIVTVEDAAFGKVRRLTIEIPGALPVHVFEKVAS